MSLKKKILSGHTLVSWNYEGHALMSYNQEKECEFTGQSMGIFDPDIKKGTAIVSIENVDTAEGVVNRIIINESIAEMYGFEIVRS